MKVDFVAGVGGRVINSSAYKCQNLYPVLDNKSKKPFALIGVPGLKEFSDTGYSKEVRGIHKFGNYFYAVVGEKFFKIDSDGSAVEQSGTLSTSSGIVFMEHNLTQIMIVDGTKGYIYVSSLEQITDSDFPSNPISLTYQDSYFICVFADTDAFYISGAEDGTSWDALEFASAEAQPDDALQIISDHRELWIFGEETTEVFQNTGNADFPFERMQGAYIEKGISGKTASKHDNSVFWLDNNGQVQRASGYTPQIVSDRQAEYQIAKLTISDAHSYTYTQEGHAFFVLVFPTDGKVLALNIETGAWHTRTSEIADNRHRGNCFTMFGSKRLVGDYENGKIYEYDYDTFDESRAIARAMVTDPERYIMFHRSLEVEFAQGVGNSDITDPQAILKYSDDQGKTWSTELWRDIGKVGEYEQRARWFKLGRSRDRIYEVILPGAFKKVISGATLHGERGTH